MPLPRTADVVVLGGGVIGCAIARAAARAGLGRVVLVERNAALGAESTARAVGGVRHQFDDPIAVRLPIESVAAIEALAAERDEPVAVARDGYLLLACDAAERRAWRAWRP